MKQTILSIVSLLLFISCSKKNDSTTPTPTPDPVPTHDITYFFYTNTANKYNLSYYDENGKYILVNGIYGSWSKQIHIARHYAEIKVAVESHDGGNSYSYVGMIENTDTIALNGGYTEVYAEHQYND